MTPPENSGRKQFLFWLVSLSFALAACSGSNVARGPRTVTVYAAASLTEAFTEIGKTFEASHTGITIAFNFGGSQNLRTQIELEIDRAVHAAVERQHFLVLQRHRAGANDSDLIEVVGQVIGKADHDFVRAVADADETLLEHGVRRHVDVQAIAEDAVAASADDLDPAVLRRLWVDSLAFIEAEGLDAAAPEQWQAVLPKLRQLLKVEAPAAKDAGPSNAAEATGDLAQA